MEQIEKAIWKMRNLNYKEFLKTANLCFRDNPKKFYILHKRALGICNTPNMDITRYKDDNTG